MSGFTRLLRAPKRQKSVLSANRMGRLLQPAQGFDALRIRLKKLHKNISFAMKTTVVIVLYVCNLEIRKSVHFTYNLNLNSNCSHTVFYAECSYNTVFLFYYHK